MFREIWKFSIVFFMVVIFSGCAADHQTGVVYPGAIDPNAGYGINTDSVDGGAKKVDEKRYAAIKVDFATNRSKDSSGKFQADISDLSDPISYGQETVLIPLNRESGSFRDSHSAMYRVWSVLGMSDASSEELISIAEGQSSVKTRDQFFKGLKQSKSLGEGDILLFVHGFNVTFEDSIKRAAQVSYDIGLNLKPVVFSWPSIGEVSKYNRDYGRALGSVLDFERFARELAKSANGRKIHILVHSMGSKVVIPALAAVYKDDPVKFKKQFGNIIFAAPDFPRAVFLKEYTKVYSKIGKATIYMSSEDKALELSSGTYLADEEMLGFSGEKGFYYPGIDSIDITKAGGVDDILGHSGYGSSSRVLTDMHYLIGGGLKAEKRAGFKIVPPHKYWVLQP